MRWQMALYKEMAGKAEDADAPVKVVKRVQEVSAVLYHLEVVSEWSLRNLPLTEMEGGISLTVLNRAYVADYSKHLNCSV